MRRRSFGEKCFAHVQLAKFLELGSCTHFLPEKGVACRAVELSGLAPVQDGVKHSIYQHKLFRSREAGQHVCQNNCCGVEVKTAFAGATTKGSLTTPPPGLGLLAKAEHVFTQINLRAGGFRAYLIKVISIEVPKNSAGMAQNASMTLLGRLIPLSFKHGI